MYRIGIDVGGTKTEYGVFDGGTVVYREKMPTNTELEPAAFFDAVSENVLRIVQICGLDVKDILGVGIGMPSFVEYNTGYIVKSANLPLIKKFAAKEYMERKLKMRVFIDNDANAAALAEHRYGAGRGFKHMLYCPMSTGISSAIIIDGKLFHGSYGWAGESGHMIIPGDDFESGCGCGNRGCFMSHISGSMITKRVQRKLDEGVPSIMSDEGAITTKLISEAAEKGDELANRAIDHMAEYLGIWLYNLYQVLNINCFVFGGGLVNMGERLFGKAFSLFGQYAPEAHVNFKFAELKDDFGIRGAAELVN